MEEAVCKSENNIAINTIDKNHMTLRETLDTYISALKEDMSEGVVCENLKWFLEKFSLVSTNNKAGERVVSGLCYNYRSALYEGDQKAAGAYLQALL